MHYLMKRSGKALKSTAVLVLVCFSFNTAGFTAPSSSVSPSSSNKSSTKLDLKTFRLSGNLGTVENIYMGKKPRTVLLIQDAHSAGDAQNSIRGIIHELEKNYGVRLVAAEGTSGKFDTLLLRSFPGRESLKKTIGEYLNSGELSGAAAASALDTQNTAYYGVEDPSLYEEGLIAFQKAQQAILEFQNELDAMKAELDLKKKEYYSKELLELDEILFSAGKPGANFTALLEGLKKMTKDFSAQDWEKYPHLKAVFLAMEKNQEAKSGEAFRAEIEQAAVLIRPKLSAGETLVFNQKLQEYQTEKNSAADFAAYLSDLGAAHQVGKAIFSAGLREEVRRQKFLQGIKGPAFFEELEACGLQIQNRLLANEEQTQLSRESRRLELAGKLLHLKLNRTEWETIKTLGVESQAERLITRFKTATAFYQNAEARENAFLKNLDSEFRQEKTEIAVVVTGGFHSSALEKRLLQSGVSHALIMPALKTIPEDSLYLEHMRGEVSWKKYFEIKNGRIDLYSSFMRAATDKLLAKDPSALKDWRDEIVRSLVAQGRIERSGEYTRFLDEAAVRSMDPAKAGALKKEWMDRAEKFIEGLGQLKTRNALDATGVQTLARQIWTADSPFHQPFGTFQPSAMLLAGRQEVREQKVKSTDPESVIQFVTKTFGAAALAQARDVYDGKYPVNPVLYERTDALLAWIQEQSPADRALIEKTLSLKSHDRSEVRTQTPIPDSAEGKKAALKRPSWPWFFWVLSFLIVLLGKVRSNDGKNASLRILFVEVRLEGLDNIPDENAVFASPTHISFWDNFIFPLAVYKTTKRLILLVADMSKLNWLFRFFVKRGGAIPAYKGAPQGENLARVVDHLEQGWDAGFFKAGSLFTSNHVETADHHDGYARAAVRTRRPVVPFAILDDGGEGNLMPRHATLGSLWTVFSAWWSGKPKRVLIRFGKPQEAVIEGDPDASLPQYQQVGYGPSPLNEARISRLRERVKQVDMQLLIRSEARRVELQDKLLEGVGLYGQKYSNVEKTPDWQRMNVIAQVILDRRSVRAVPTQYIIEEATEKMNRQRLGVRDPNRHVQYLLDRMVRSGFLKKQGNGYVFAEDRKKVMAVKFNHIRYILKDFDDLIGGAQSGTSGAENHLFRLIQEYAQASRVWPLYPVESTWPVLKAINLLDKSKQDFLIDFIQSRNQWDARDFPFIGNIFLMLRKEIPQDWAEKNVPNLKGRTIYYGSPETWIAAGGLGRVGQYHTTAMARLLKGFADVATIEPYYPFRVDKNGELHRDLNYSSPNLPVPVEQLKQVAKFTINVRRGGHSEDKNPPREDVEVAVYKGTNKFGMDVYLIRDIPKPGDDEYYTKLLYRYGELGAAEKYEFAEFMGKARVKLTKILEKQRFDADSKNYKPGLDWDNDGQMGLGPLYRRVSDDLDAYLENFPEGEEREAEIRRLKKDKNFAFQDLLTDPKTEMSLAGFATWFTTHTFKNRIQYGWEIVDGLGFKEGQRIHSDIPIYGDRYRAHFERFEEYDDEGRPVGTKTHADFSTAGMTDSDGTNFVATMHAQSMSHLTPGTKGVANTNGDDREATTVVWRAIFDNESFQARFPGADPDYPTAEQIRVAKKMIKQLAKAEPMLLGLTHFFSEIDPDAPVFAYSGRLVEEKAGMGRPALDERGRMITDNNGRVVFDDQGRALTEDNIRFLVESGATVVVFGNEQAAEESRALRKHSEDLESRLNDEQRRKGGRGRFIYATGWGVKEQRYLLALIDVLIVDSNDRTEANGITELDAMACGAAVVSRETPEGALNLHGEIMDLETPGVGNTMIPNVQDDVTDKSLYDRMSREAADRENYRRQNRKVKEAYQEVYRLLLGKYAENGGENFSEYQRTSVLISKVLKAEMTAAAYARGFSETIGRKEDPIALLNQYTTGDRSEGQFFKNEWLREALVRRLRKAATPFSDAANPSKNPAIEAFATSHISGYGDANIVLVERGSRLGNKAGESTVKGAEAFRAIQEQLGLGEDDYVVILDAITLKEYGKYRLSYLLKTGLRVAVPSDTHVQVLKVELASAPSNGTGTNGQVVSRESIFFETSANAAVRETLLGLLPQALLTQIGTSASDLVWWTPGDGYSPAEKEPEELTDPGFYLLADKGDGQLVLTLTETLQSRDEQQAHAHIVLHAEGNDLVIGFGRMDTFPGVAEENLGLEDVSFRYWFQKHLASFAKKFGFRRIRIRQQEMKEKTLIDLGFKKISEKQNGDFPEWAFDSLQEPPAQQKIREVLSKARQISEAGNTDAAIRYVEQQHAVFSEDEATHRELAAKFINTLLGGPGELSAADLERAGRVLEQELAAYPHQYVDLRALAGYIRDGVVDIQGRKTLDLKKIGAPWDFLAILKSIIVLQAHLDGQLVRVQKLADDLSLEWERQWSEFKSGLAYDKLFGAHVNADSQSGERAPRITPGGIEFYLTPEGVKKALQKASNPRLIAELAFVLTGEKIQEARDLYEKVERDLLAYVAGSPAQVTLVGNFLQDKKWGTMNDGSVYVGPHALSSSTLADGWNAPREGKFSHEGWIWTVGVEVPPQALNKELHYKFVIHIKTVHGALDLFLPDPAVPVVGNDGNSVVTVWQNHEETNKLRPQNHEPGKLTLQLNLQIDTPDAAQLRAEGAKNKVQWLAAHLQQFKDEGYRRLLLGPGTLQISSLPYLSPYAPSAYTSEYGTTQDFAELQQKAAELGIEIVFDVVAGHTDIHRQPLPESSYIHSVYKGQRFPLSTWGWRIDDQNPEAIGQLIWWLESTGIKTLRADVGGAISPWLWWELRRRGFKILAEWEEPQAQGPFDETYFGEALRKAQEGQHHDVRFWDYRAALENRLRVTGEGRRLLLFINNHDQNLHRDGLAALSRGLSSETASKKTYATIAALMVLHLLHKDRTSVMEFSTDRFGGESRVSFMFGGVEKAPEAYRVSQNGFAAEHAKLTRFVADAQTKEVHEFRTANPYLGGVVVGGEYALVVNLSREATEVFVGKTRIPVSGYEVKIFPLQNDRAELRAAARFVIGELASGDFSEAAAREAALRETDSGRAFEDELRDAARAEVRYVASQGLNFNAAVDTTATAEALARSGQKPEAFAVALSGGDMQAFSNLAPDSEASQFLDTLVTVAGAGHQILLTLPDKAVAEVIKKHLPALFQKAFGRAGISWRSRIELVVAPENEATQQIGSASYLRSLDVIAPYDQAARISTNKLLADSLKRVIVSDRIADGTVMKAAGLRLTARILVEAALVGGTNQALHNLKTSRLYFADEQLAQNLAAFLSSLNITARQKIMTAA